MTDRMLEVPALWDRHVSRGVAEGGSAKVAEQAIFWFGHSKDPRALDYFESVLVKR